MLHASEMATPTNAYMSAAKIIVFNKSWQSFLIPKVGFRWHRLLVSLALNDRQHTQILQDSPT